ncbi:MULTISPECIES: hypothetical protein [Alteromonadaceae]|uniref:hypothetical protein n=1 Tax=Alteromonadaceae TaxID=72275 RepID=UPI001C09BB1A|nr:MULTISPECIES: hypothetical protein [Aliiglaciecola]MBU2880067.1 hypothetical protein [Aliiglaciecola lipolytica]MDO6710935.1 hypothetical protein [Aliiglaciecola sp. 2_MG-2023]MDO6752416.1 hypothetical protein [Aliiglaciecola sp. 1_MG-2023]
MEIESSLVAAQNQLTITPTAREPQKQAEAQEQQNQRRDTQLPRQQVVTRQNSPEAYAQAERFREQKNSASQPQDFSARQAIDAYQSLAKESQRSEIQSLLGIDTFV